MVKEFGWTIEYTLSRTFPVFMALTKMLRRIRYDAAIDEFYLPYSAAKLGGKCAKRLFEGRGSFMLNDSGNNDGETSPEQIDRAIEKIRKIIAAKHAAVQTNIE